ncbi:MAG: glycine--tRNA ligase subunit beta [Deltaproteobacteria bacterium]|nr:glycine--tRNA ligase subunit beta [Deltaproteobacteria bacterium]
MKKDFILELLCEELPVKEQLGFLKTSGNYEEFFRKNRLDFDSLKLYVTPRRMSVCVSGLDTLQRGLEEEIIGPPVDIAVKDSRPTKAGEGFSKKTGVLFEKMHQVERNNRLYLACMHVEEGRSTAQVLSENLPELIRSIKFTKSMRWGDNSYTFSRPLKSILAVFGEEEINFSVHGISSGRKLFGHRFLSPDFVELRKAEDYRETLKNHNVYVDQQERKRLIERELNALSEDHGLELIEDPGLLEEVSLLVEQPTVVIGEFSGDFLDVPQEAILSAMRKHQRYFAFKKGGSLAPNFATALGTRLKNPGEALKGNERVLTARLSDAVFFWKEDLSKPLESRKPRLQNMIYHKKLGTLWDKVERIVKLSKWFSSIAGSDTEKTARTAYLCKMDLETLMVYEFPELQGLMGMAYAQRQNEDPAVCRGIFEHYLPRNAQDILPETPEGIAVALADKLDTITGGIAAGLKPGGSSDAFALRRNALGVIKITFEHQLQYSISDAIEAASGSLELTCDVDEVKNFIIERLKNFLSESSSREAVEAVCAASDDDIFDVRKRLQAIESMSASDVFKSLVALFKRMNILKKVEHVSNAVNADILSEKSEIDLYNSILDIESDVEKNVSSGNYSGALEKLSSLYDVVDTFFDDEKGVRIMSDDEAVKENRLALLGKLDVMFRKIADFKMLAGIL